MPILKAIGKNKDKKKGSTKQTLAGMKALLDYIARVGREEQIYKAFGMGISDNVDKANRTIIFNKKTHDKVDNNLYKHYLLSYANKRICTKRIFRQRFFMLCRDTYR